MTENAITSEILKDTGYGDLANEEAVVRKVKENIGLVPENLDNAIADARKFRGKPGQSTGCPEHVSR